MDVEETSQKSRCLLGAPLFRLAFQGAVVDDWAFCDAPCRPAESTHAERIAIIGYDAGKENKVKARHIDAGREDAGQDGAGEAETRIPTLLPTLEKAPDASSPCWRALERFRWAEGLAFVSHGARIGVRTTDAALLDCLRDHLPPGARPALTPVVDGLFSLAVVESRSQAHPEPHYFLYQGACRVAHTRQADEALHALASGLHGQVAGWARERLFVHAGVVGWNGKAILIPGRTFSGKSSLVAALVRAGATYFSDEYAVLDADGSVHPYAKPLSLRDAEGQARGSYPVEALGGQAATGPLPVGMVLAAQYEAGARWRPRPLSPGQAMLILLGNTVQVRTQPQAAMQVLQQAALGAEAFQSKRGEAEQVADWVRKHFRGDEAQKTADGKGG